MKVDMSAALPDFMFDRFGWTDFYAIETAYAIDVMLMTVDFDVHWAHQLTRFTFDTLLLVHLQSPQAETVEYRIYCANRTERAAEESLDGDRQDYDGDKYCNFHVVVPADKCFQVARFVSQNQRYPGDQSTIWAELAEPGLSSYVNDNSCNANKHNVFEVGEKLG
jgi:hypothetical protein